MELLGIDIAFFIFTAILVGIAVFHKHTLKIALVGLALLLAYKYFFSSLNLADHLGHEWKELLNLFGLLIGFAVLASHVESSGVPGLLPKILPDDWKGPFVLLLLVFVLSAILDNIAAAMIGGGIAHVVFRKKVHIGYIAAIVAAGNAGGSGSVLGDTTTTMMWIAGIKAVDVLHAYVAAIPAFLIFGIIASIRQHRHQPVMKNEVAGVHINWKRIGICGMILAGAITANIQLGFPALGVWVAIAAGAFVAKTDWTEAREALSGSIFLLALVLAASLMPVDELPDASWPTALGLGFLSAVFDNIPLTKLALSQGGYDWGILAYAVGFGGSILWFGSSAGVAISAIYPEARSVKDWLLNGWYIALAYVAGFFILLAILGWNPHPVIP